MLPAQADVGGGLVICAIGIDAVRHVRQRREFLALAWIPPLLGAHQFIEALILPSSLFSGFASIWCAWAAVSSAAIALHCRFDKADPQRAGTGLAG